MEVEKAVDALPVGEEAILPQGERRRRSWFGRRGGK